eukprot:COSAG03_NODE_1957_length_3301_cov_12.017489_7_plen_39_part_00
MVVGNSKLALQAIELQRQRAAPAESHCDEKKGGRGAKL